MEWDWVSYWTGTRWEYISRRSFPSRNLILKYHIRNIYSTGSMVNPISLSLSFGSFVSVALRGLLVEVVGRARGGGLGGLGVTNFESQRITSPRALRVLLGLERPTAYSLDNDAHPFSASDLPPLTALRVRSILSPDRTAAHPILL